MSANKLRFTPNACLDLENLKNDSCHEKALKAILKTLALMESNLRHPSLKTHEFKSLKGPNGEKVFEAYAQQSTPGAYRIFFYYGPERGIISVVAIIRHPEH